MAEYCEPSGKKVTLLAQNEEFTTKCLSGDEERVFNKEFEDLFYPPWNLERRYIVQNKGFLMDGIGVAKHALDELRFGGFNAGANELGISPIRPGHVGMAHAATTTVAEADQTWEWASNASAPAYGTGFENWIHSPTTATTAFSVHEDSFIIPMYVVEESASPKIQTLKIDAGRSDILYYDVRASVLRDAQTGISLIPLPKMFWSPNDTVLVAIQAKEAGAIEPRLGGFTVAKGTFLDATTYTVSTNTVATSTVAAT
jgi:hypothetical protein